jgi:hypothetical protein
VAYLFGGVLWAGSPCRGDFLTGEWGLALLAKTAKNENKAISY